jgi:hypothetical protein
MRSAAASASPTTEKSVRPIVSVRSVGKSGRDFLHRPLDRTGELAGARRRLHAAGGANEKVIPEQVAQAVEGVAHRRLGDADAHRRKLHPPLGKQRVERLEQVEVDRSNILHMNFIDAKY